jgi:hypothetical protein
MNLLVIGNAPVLDQMMVNEYTWNESTQSWDLIS